MILFGRRTNWINIVLMVLIVCLASKILFPKLFEGYRPNDPQMEYVKRSLLTQSLERFLEPNDAKRAAWLIPLDSLRPIIDEWVDVPMQPSLKITIIDVLLRFLPPNFLPVLVELRLRYQVLRDALQHESVPAEKRNIHQYSDKQVREALKNVPVIQGGLTVEQRGQVLDNVRETLGLQ